MSLREALGRRGGARACEEIRWAKGITMSNQRGRETASADKAVKRHSEVDRDTAASAAQPPADPGGTIDVASPAAPGEVTGEYSLTNPPSPAKQATLDFDSRAAGTAHPSGTVDVSVFDSEGSGGAGNCPKVAGYQILGELGRGGMGVVYKARQRGLQRLVALKMILAGAHAGEHQRARFGTEAEAVARLQHPNIVQIYEVGQHEGLPYFSLEFVDGGPLDKRIAGKPQPPREAARLIETLARAMHFAHRQGIVHRDLKPANVLLQRKSEAPNPKSEKETGAVSDFGFRISDFDPKITDFGLAKRLEEGDASRTKSGTIVGTPNYMAPEQARGEVRNVGPHTDLYALGAILYELLTGRPPFQGPDVMDTVLQVTRDEPVPPARLQPNTPRDLETICLKCLQKEPPKRYAACFELAEDLRRFLAGEPIRARPVGPGERLWRWCRRNPKLAGAAATILLLVLIGSVGSTWAALAIRAEKELAERNEKKALASEKVARDNEQKARASARLAQEQAELALKTLGLLINKVESQLGKQPGAQQLRRELLETAMSGLKQVTGAAAGKMRRTTGDAYFKMGGIARELGNTADASKYWQRYYEMARSALKDNPENERLKLEMAWACRFLGEISVERGDLKKALAYYRSALALRKELAAVPLAERMRRNEKLPPEDRLTPRVNVLQLSEEYTRIGLINYFTGESALAEGPVLKSLALREDLLNHTARDQAVWFMTANPAAGPNVLSVAASLPGLVGQVRDARQNLARNYHLMGEVYFRLRNLKRSRLYYQKCEDTREAILRDDEKEVERLGQLGKLRPPDFRLMGDLAEFHRMYGAMLFSLGAPLPEVLAHIDRAIALSRRVLEMDKAVEARQNLAKSLYTRGVVAARAGDQQTAGKCFRECLAIRQELADRDVRSYRQKVDLLEVLARAGKHEKAAQLAENLRLTHPKDAAFLICAARCYAQCSLAVPDKPALRQKYLGMALASLETALKQGYKDVITLETHPDLDPVRASPAFQKLLEK
jgi:serine/threonine protein kinase/tetratricopeptide (TPR) repeat protein